MSHLKKLSDLEDATYTWVDALMLVSYFWEYRNESKPWLSIIKPIEDIKK